ncbi:hypothetical protein GCM10010252_61410 [Streptomyces aureoverticillatus]|nr:hypothetical protein GCM10010252_61410 [Streptomyces aureoverticillatus]
MSPRNIFLVGIDVDSMGGSQRVMHTLAQGLGDRGHCVELIGIRPSNEPHTYNVRPAYRHTTLYREPPTSARQAATLAQRLDPTRIRRARAGRRERMRARSLLAQRFATVDDGYLIVGSPWAVDWLQAVEWPHLKGIGQYHESFLQAHTSANLGLIQRHYPTLEKSVFLSEGDAAEFRRRRLPNAEVVPNPLPFTPTGIAPLNTKRIGAVGRLEAVKRLDRLLQAFAMAAADHPDWELHIFGDGPQKAALGEYAERCGIAERVYFRGRVQDMATAYQEMSLVALTSEREGRPMALAEASACGVPCISYDLSGGVRELVDHARTGTLVQPGDTAAFADALRVLIEDDTRRERYGRAAREHVSTLALPTVLDRWESLFDQIER